MYNYARNNENRETKKHFTILKSYTMIRTNWIAARIDTLAVKKEQSEKREPPDKGEIGVSRIW